MEKQCRFCGRVLPVTPEYFHRNHGMADGFLNKCRDCVREYHAEYYSRRKDHVLGKVQAYRERNRDAINERKRQEYAQDPQKVRSRGKESYERHREGYIERANARRARKRSAEGQYTRRDVEDQRKRQGDRCYWCGEKLGDIAHADHVWPLARGGSNHPSNIVVACQRCNCSKHDKSPWDFPRRDGQSVLC